MNDETTVVATKVGLLYRNGSLEESFFPWSSISYLKTGLSGRVIVYFNDDCGYEGSITLPKNVTLDDIILAGKE